MLGPAARVEYAKGPDIRRDIPSFFDALVPGPKMPPETGAEAEDAFAKNLPDPEQYNFLSKPFTLKQLIEEVKRTMAQPTAQA